MPIDPEYHKRLEKAVSDLEDQVSTLRGAYLKSSKENQTLRNVRYSKMRDGAVPRDDNIHVFVIGRAAVGKSTVAQIISDALEAAGVADHETIFLDGEPFISHLDERVQTMNNNGIKVNVVERQMSR